MCNEQLENETLNIILDVSKKTNNSGINLAKYMQEPLYLKLIILLKKKGIPKKIQIILYL